MRIRMRSVLMSWDFLDGRVFRALLTTKMGDTIVGRVWSYRDVTDRKRAEHDLTESGPGTGPS